MIGYIFKKSLARRTSGKSKSCDRWLTKSTRWRPACSRFPTTFCGRKPPIGRPASQNRGHEELARALDEILPEAFAVVKNACRRLCGQEIMVRQHPLKWEMIPFDVQLIGGSGLHR